MSRGRGRVPPEELERDKAEALRLFVEQGLKPKDIGHRLNYTAYSINKWIREARLRRPAIDLVRERLDAGTSVQEIAGSLGLSLGHVYTLVRQIRESERSEERDDEAVRAFLADPLGFGSTAAAKTLEFGCSLNRHLAAVTTRNPSEGLDLFPVVVGHFERLCASECLAHAVCRLFQTQTIRAHALSTLGLHGDAVSAIEGVTPPGECRPCLGLHKMRHGAVLAEWAYHEKRPTIRARRWRFSLDLIDRAVAVFSNSPSDEHDVFGNGLAHSLMLRAQTKYCAGSASECVKDAHLGIDAIAPGSRHAGPLVRRLHSTLGLGLASSPDSADLLRAQEIFRHRLASSAGSITVTYVMVRWSAARVEISLGNSTAALPLFEDALDAAVRLRLRASVGAMVADMIQAGVERREVLAQIEGLAYVDGVNSIGSPPLPTYLPRRLSRGLRALVEALEATQADVLQIAADLRRSAEASARGGLIPALA